MKIAKQVPDKFAPVSLEPVVLHGVDTGKMSVVLDDPTLGKTPVSIVGGNYGIWSNHDAVKVAEEIMHRSEYSWSPVHEIWTGRQLNAFWKSNEQLIQLPEVGDAIQLGLRLENSYDGTCKLRIAIMAFVLTCTNGMVSDRSWGVFSIRHNRGRDVDWADAVAQLAKGAGNLIDHADSFRSMSSAHFELDSLLNVAGDSGLNPRFIGNYVKSLSEKRREQTASLNLWEALNLGTEMLANPTAPTGVRQLEAFTNSFLDLTSRN